MRASSGSAFSVHGASQLALECGYTAASIRERIYSFYTEHEDGPMVGILFYTAAPDSEGTLGGLVGLGVSDQLLRLILPLGFAESARGSYTKCDTSILGAEIMERKQRWRLTMEHVPVLVITKDALWRFV